MNDIIWLQFLRCVLNFPTNSQFREFWESFAKLFDIVSEIDGRRLLMSRHLCVYYPSTLNTNEL